MRTEHPSLASLDVLIVDDSASMRALLERVLSAAGVAALRTAEDAASALAALSERRASLIILDHSMPGMSGVELVRKLRAQPAFDARIIMLSGHSDPRHLAEARAAGVDDVLVKPIGPRDMLARIEAVLQRAAA